MTGFKRIEHMPARSFTNEFGNPVKIGVQGGNCTGMGNPRANETLTFMIQGPKSDTFNQITILESAHLRDMLTEMLARLDTDPTRDKCQMCKGQRGGTPGNENIVYGMTVCDYCHADIMTATDAVRDETLAAASQIACLVAGDMKRSVSNPYSEAIESVRLTPDRRWQSEKAMHLWGFVTS